jgi:hypothetical protein
VNIVNLFRDLFPEACFIRVITAKAGIRLKPGFRIKSRVTVATPQLAAGLLINAKFTFLYALLKEIQQKNAKRDVRSSP